MTHTTRYQITLTTITPLHIGSGVELRADFDFITDSKATYRLDINRLVEDKAEQMHPDHRGQYPLPVDLLSDADKRKGTYFRYRLIGRPTSTKRDARLKEGLKDVYDRPYIPGSSLKGAVRTALAWSVWPTVKPKTRDYRPKASKIEQQIFGKNPNYDLLRALQISDLVTEQTASDVMWVANINVVGKGGENQIPIEMETIKGSQTFHGTITLDDYLFENTQARSMLGLSGKRQWLVDLCQHINHYSLDRVQRFLHWFENTPRCEQVYKTYLQLNSALEDGLPEGQAVLHVGYGGGWDSKTFSSRLQDDEELWARIVKSHKLSRKRIDPQRPYTFPATRRAVKHPTRNSYAKPLGWVLMDMQKVSQ